MSRLSEYTPAYFNYLVKEILDKASVGGKVDQTQLEMAFLFTQMSEDDQENIRKHCLSISETCYGISPLSALEIVFKVGQECVRLEKPLEYKLAIENQRRTEKLMKRYWQLENELEKARADLEVVRRCGFWFQNEKFENGNRPVRIMRGRDSTYIPDQAMK